MIKLSKKHPAHFIYFTQNLKSIINTFIEDNLRKKDWEIEAIDPVKDVVILKRWCDGEHEH